MPYFIPNTPKVRGKPVVCSFVDLDGTTKRTVTTIPDGASPTSIQADTFAQAKGDLSNLGLYQVKGGGFTLSVSKSLASVSDELYSIGTTLLCEFEAQDGSGLKAYDRIPAPNLAYIDGYQLKPRTASTTIDTYINSAEALLSVGGVNYDFTGSVIEGMDAKIRTFPIPSEPTGEAGEPTPDA